MILGNREKKSNTSYRWTIYTYATLEMGTPILKFGDLFGSKRIGSDEALQSKIRCFNQCFKFRWIQPTLLSKIQASVYFKSYK